MIRLISLTARRELLASVRQRYRDANWAEKGKILNGFIAATDHERKYAIRLLRTDTVSTPSKSDRLNSNTMNKCGRRYWQLGTPLIKFSQNALFLFCHNW